MSTLADQFHDSFEPYYAGRKQSWLERKSAQRPLPKTATPDQDKAAAEQEKPADERRH